jgi:hypothetical protein
MLLYDLWVPQIVVVFRTLKTHKFNRIKTTENMEEFLAYLRYRDAPVIH